MVHDDDLIRERVQRIIHLENLTQREFANKLGRQPSNVSQIMNNERSIPKGFVADILRVFPKIRKEWLVFGEGAMYEDEEVTDKPQVNTKPRLPRTLTAGHLQDYFEGSKRHLCQEKPIISQFPDYDFSLFLKTDRMAPNYRRGDELFFKKTELKEWGNCYLLDTNEGPKFKKVYEDKDKDGKPVYRCVAYDREQYPDFTIPQKNVFGFYKCVGALRIL